MAGRSPSPAQTAPRSTRRRRPCRAGFSQHIHISQPIFVVHPIQCLRAGDERDPPPRLILQVEGGHGERHHYRALLWPCGRSSCAIDRRRGGISSSRRCGFRRMQSGKMTGKRDEVGGEERKRIASEEKGFAGCNRKERRISGRGRRAASALVCGWSLENLKY
ncbi:hypothetical protein KSP39_PZI007034 [Platanthera zijinensis]|uniref:Uncharacterized protein n=1 Tax=Platanthera zijinensis TaxID=2320716 RepID=A0AAP0BR03_9ASPA